MKEVEMSKLPRRFALVLLIMVFLLVQPVPGAQAAAAGGNDYEIPLSDLKKVEKKKAKKSGVRGHKEKKKESAAPVVLPEVSPVVSEAAEVSGHSAPLPQETVKVPVPPKTIQQDVPTESVRTVHEPNSYVVTGKRTVILAFVSDSGQIQSVRCQFRTAEGEGYGIVPMTREEGRLYTYTALLPALAQGEQALRYRFNVVDAAGKEAYSREYVVPVRPTSVVPGWQQEPSREIINVELTNADKPLKGFVDVLVRGSRKQ
jgi:hypothetical protein